MDKGRFGAAVFGASLAGALSLAGSSVQAGELNEPLFLFPLAVPVDPLTPEATEPTITPTADYTEPVAPPARSGWTWAITPRVWLLWETDHYFQDDVRRYDFGFPFDNLVLHTQISNKATFIPFAGGSISVTPGTGRPTYSLTVLYGEGTAENVGVLSFDVPILDPIFGFGSNYEGTVETRRLDVELIAQIPAAEGFNWALGARFINFRRDEEGELLIGTEEPIASTVKFDLEQNFYLAEAGFGLNRPITSDGSWFAFGNITGML